MLSDLEAEEVLQHIRQKVAVSMGGRDSKAYANVILRSKALKNLLTRIKMEYGLVSSYIDIERRYIADLHDFIDSYELPRVLEERVNEENNVSYQSP